MFKIKTTDNLIKLKVGVKLYMSEFGFEKQLTELRILLNKFCDGFNALELNKNNTLTFRCKMLHLLGRYGERPPKFFIDKLCLAKGNLTQLCKPLIDDSVIGVKKNTASSRGIVYYLTETGYHELENIYSDQHAQFEELPPERKQLLELKVNELIKQIQLCLD